MNWKRGEYLISDDPACLDLNSICAMLETSYWAAGRPRESTAKAIQNSLCFGLYYSGKQVGFARAITDRATFSYLGDVIIAPEHRGRGLGKWLVETMLAHPELQTNTQCLRTRDAHTLYEHFGFERTEFMRRSSNDEPKQEMH